MSIYQSIIVGTAGSSTRHQADATTKHFTWSSINDILMTGYTPLLWIIAFLLAVLLAGCGGGGNVTGGISLQSKEITAYSLNGIAGTVNESAKTIAVTVPYATNVTAMVATYSSNGFGIRVGTTDQMSAATANNFTSPVLYTVTARNLNTAVYTVTVTIAPNTAKAMTAFSFAGYAGATSTINEPAKTIAVTVPNGTDVTTLVATFSTTGSSVEIGAAVQTSAATANNFSSPVAYIVTAADATTATYTVTVTVAPSTAKVITAFSFAGYTGANGVINEPAKTIAVTVPNGTNVTALVATFTTTGADVKVGATVQTSVATANNFTTPVIYTVTAADASTVNYTITVTVAPSTAKAITAYSFAGYTGATGTINEALQTIAVTVPNGTDVTTLVATFATTGASVNVGAAVQTSIATANNFTSPVAYIVTAADATTATYTVTVTIAPSAAKAITAFSFAGYLGATGVINETAKTIAVTVPGGTDVTTLIATFTTTGTIVKVDTAVQTSTATANNFTSPVAYTVTAANATTATYTVTVALAAANPTAPTLGEAGRFVIMANQAITTTGTTAISNGDIGIMPAARSLISGFTPTGPAGDFTELTGLTWAGMASTSYAQDDANPSPFPAPLAYVSHAPYATTLAMLNQATTDLGSANTFLNATNPTAPTQVCETELGTLTKTRGVYKTSSDVGITTGSLTLDAQGDPNAVFIFVIGGTLTTGVSGSIVLANSAQAKNVFWTTGGITTIGAGTIFYGSVFAATQVNVLAGTQITGSLFGITDRVTLIADTITKAP